MADRWRERCLIEDGSLLFNDRSLWREGALAELRSRLQLPSSADESGFAPRLASQLSDASPELRWLAAEVIAVYAMPVHRIMGTDKKVELVRQALGTLDPTEAPEWSN